MWRAVVILDRYKNLQEPVLGWIVMWHMISRMILIPLNTSNNNCLEYTMGEEEISSHIAFGHIISGVVKSVASSLPPQCSTGVEMKIFSALNL
jgi:hypothetical protein